MIMVDYGVYTLEITSSIMCHMQIQEYLRQGKEGVNINIFKEKRIWK